MGRQIRVRAREGVQVPREGSRRQIGQEPVVVTESSYYRRRLADGDLILVGTVARVGTAAPGGEE